MKRWAVVPLVFACATIATPWLMSRVPILSFALQRGFSLVCHQLPGRSFILFGGAIAVCARCLGIYLGAAAGLLVLIPRQFARRLLTAATALNLVDWLAELAGLHGNWMATRFLLGITLGAAAAMLVTASIGEGNNIPPQATAA